MLKLLLSIILMMSSVVKAEDFIPDSFSVESTQKKIIKGKSGEKSQRGTLHYLFPGYFRLESNVATKTILTINHQTTWFFQEAYSETKEKSEVEVSPSKSLPLIKALDSIKKGLDSSPHFSKKNVGFDITLIAKPDFSEESNIQEIQFKSRRNSIKTLKDVKNLITIEVDGKTTSYEFDEFKEEHFSKDHFTFKIPLNTKVTTKK